MVTTSNSSPTPTTGMVSGSHLYAYRPAPYSVVVTLQDVAGATVTQTFQVTVLDPALSSVTAGPDRTVNEGDLTPARLGDARIT